MTYMINKSLRDAMQWPWLSYGAYSVRISSSGAKTSP